VSNEISGNEIRLSGARACDFSLVCVVFVQCFTSIDNVTDRASVIVMSPRTGSNSAAAAAESSETMTSSTAADSGSAVRGRRFTVRDRGPQDLLEVGKEGRKIASEAIGTVIL
jgi:hypothetical protein